LIMIGYQCGTSFTFQEKYRKNQRGE